MMGFCVEESAAFCQRENNNWQQNLGTRPPEARKCKRREEEQSACLVSSGDSKQPKASAKVELQSPRMMLKLKGALRKNKKHDIYRNRKEERCDPADRRAMRPAKVT